MKEKELDSIIDFIVKVNAIKSTRRTGWVVRKLPIPEHVADHCFSTALLSYIFARRMGLDADKCMLMGLTHDIHEAVTGDFGYRGGKERILPVAGVDEKMRVVTDKRKKALEHRDALRLLAHLPASDRKALLSSSKELERENTAEAKLVKEIDSLDYIIELLVHAPYNESQKGRIEEFFATASKKIKNKDLLYVYNKAKAAVLGKN